MLIEHPFAPYIRTLGKGRNGARDLSRDEARDAMTLVFRGEAEPEQVGAFMMLMRVKEETAEELAGFTDALRSRLPGTAHKPRVAIDWPAYAGKRRHLPWFLLAALVLAGRDYPVFMHGLERDDDRLYLDAALSALGLSSATSLAGAAAGLQRDRFAYLPAQNLSPLLQELIEIRLLLGLRTPLHTVARMLNPFDAPLSLIGVFHPNYGPIHRQAAALLNSGLGHGDVLVCKGEGGEFERVPDRDANLLGLAGGENWTTQWPKLMQPGRVVPKQTLDTGHLREVWLGRSEDLYGEQAVIGTLALAIRGLGLEREPDGCHALAASWWRERREYTPLGAPIAAGAEPGKREAVA